MQPSHREEFLVETTDTLGPESHLSQNRVLRPGLSFHFSSEREQQDFTRCGTVDDHLRIVMLLEGSLDVAYGSSRVCLEGRDGHVNAAMVAMSEPEDFRRVVRRGVFSRQVSIGLDRQWIEESLYGSGRVGLDAAELFTHRHLATSRWQCSAHARALAEQMLNPPPLLPQLSGMYLESRAIELIIEAWSSCGLANEPTSRRPVLRPTLQRRMQDLKVWLEDNASQALSIEQIARQVSTTPATLQRHFRLAHGMSVFEFLQRTRMQQALHALEQEGVSVGQAALIAGYANPANFSTAFRRHYGVTPRQVRLRV